MAEIKLNFDDTNVRKNITHYIGTDGYTTGSMFIGNDHSSSNEWHTVCIPFTTPALTDATQEGYNSFTFKLENAYWFPYNAGKGGEDLEGSNSSYTHRGEDANTLFRFAISESDTEYININTTALGDGFICCEDNATTNSVNNSTNGPASQGFYTLTGSVAKQLSPNTTYYLWLFPSFAPKSFRYWALSGYSYTQSIYITLTEGSQIAPPPEITSTILWVFDGTSWVQGIQRVFDGNSWT